MSDLPLLEGANERCHIIMMRRFANFLKSLGGGGPSVRDRIANFSDEIGKNEPIDKQYRKPEAHESEWEEAMKHYEKEFQ